MEIGLFPHLMIAVLCQLIKGISHYMYCTCMCIFWTYNNTVSIDKRKFGSPQTHDGIMMIHISLYLLSRLIL
jgi:hypothetical protein